MKNIIKMGLIIVLLIGVVFLLTGCGEEKETSNSKNTNTESSSNSENEDYLVDYSFNRDYEFVKSFGESWGKHSADSSFDYFLKFTGTITFKYGDKQEFPWSTNFLECSDLTMYTGTGIPLFYPSDNMQDISTWYGGGR